MLPPALKQRVRESFDRAAVTYDAAAVVRDLLTRYIAEPQQMADGWWQLAPGLDAHRLARLAADFVAGMTDRYALGEHRRLFAATPQLR